MCNNGFDIFEQVPDVKPVGKRNVETKSRCRLRLHISVEKLR